MFKLETSKSAKTSNNFFALVVILKPLPSTAKYLSTTIFSVKETSSRSVTVSHSLTLSIASSNEA